MAGFYYVRNCLNALAILPPEEVPTIKVFVPASFSEELIYSDFAPAASWLEIVRVSDEMLDVHSNGSDLQSLVDRHPFDLLFPMLVLPAARFAARSIGWIPDYQHKHHPEFFAAQELRQRDLLFDFLIAFCDRILCNSKSVQNDLDRFFPEARQKGVLLHPISMIPPSSLAVSPQSTLERLGIDHRYVYLPNQFWMHKNHRLVFEAWNILKRSGENIPLICTGGTSDYRHPQYFDQLTDYLTGHDLQKMIRVLGLIDRNDQVQLYRSATVVLQPSLFEGWNTSIEEARSLGKRLIVSDTEVHREQVGSEATYFNKQDAEHLASLVQESWKLSADGFDAQVERAAYEKAQARGKEFGRALIRLFDDVTTSELESAIPNKESILPLMVELGRLRERSQALEAETATRLDLINQRGGEIMALEARVSAFEADSAQRLDLINLRGGEITALKARINALEADSAQRLDLINQRGGEIQALRAALDHLQSESSSRQELLNQRAVESALLEELINKQSGEIAAVRAQLDRIHQDGFAWLLATETRSAPEFEFLNPAKEDLISVVIPAYNAARFLERCVRSVWNQHLDSGSMEILVCDDGSTDSTHDLALTLQADSPVPMQVLTHPSRANKGVSATRNLALRHARGAYLALLDADDTWLPTRLAIQMEYLKQNRHAHSVCSYGYNRDLDNNLVTGWNGSVIAGDFRNVPPPNHFYSPYTFDQLLEGDPVVNSTLLIRREALAAAGGYPEVMAHQAEDWFLLTKLSLQGPIELIAQPLINYTVHPESYTTQYVTQGLAFGVRIEFLHHLVHWMVLHPGHHDLGIQVFRRQYPRLIAARRGAYALIEEFYRHHNPTLAGVTDFEAHLHSVYTELEALRQYHQTMERRLEQLRRVPGIVNAFRGLKTLRRVIRSRTHPSDPTSTASENAREGQKS